jgi:hypothetical protein
VVEMQAVDWINDHVVTEYAIAELRGRTLA